MDNTLKRHRWNTIGNWKRRGLIYPDYDELYQTYINTLECQHCLKVFITTRDRCLDHCHITGQFRKIVCQQCNLNDSYINYPDGITDEIINERNQHKKTYQDEYRANNKEKIKDWQHQKHDCVCGGRYTQQNKLRHMKTEKHQNYLDNNN